MIHLMHGDDAYRRDAALRQLVAGLGDPAALALNTTRFDAATPIGVILGAATTVPFMADHRLVIVDHLGARLQPRREDAAEDGADAPAGTEVRSAIEAWAAAPPPWGVVIFRDDQLRQTNPLLKAVQAAGRIAHFPPLERDDLARWIAEEALRRGGSLEPGAAGLLAAQCPDSWTASLELDKLLAYAGGRAVQTADVRLLTPPAADIPDMIIFQILDEVIARHPDQAVAALHDAMADDRHPLAILATLATLVRNLVLADAWRARDLPESDLMQALGIKPGQNGTLRRRLGQLRQLGSVRARQALHSIAMTDLAIKTGDVSPEVGLELLVVQLAR